LSRIRAAFAIALCGYGLAQASLAWGAAELRDDRDIAVRLAAPAARIVTLAPHLAEIVFAAGAEEKLVGVALFSDYPAGVRQLPLVGDASRIDIERVLLLRPDLVLAWKSGNQPGDVLRLEQLGVPVFVTEPVRLPDVSRLIRAVGVLAGTQRRAENTAARFEAEIGALRGRFSTRRAIRVFYEIWHRPLLTVNSSHMISDVIRLCGGRNVFAAAPMLTPTVSLEAVLAAQPEVIVGGGSGISARDFETQWRNHRIPTLQKRGLIHVAPDEIQRASPRIAAGARTVCEGLERFRAMPR
jgi:iron complex transport system substrate-binding protein